MLPGSSSRLKSAATPVGNGGEDFVAEWLHQQGWHLLHRRWYCRWGEIDLIAQSAQADRLIAFIEVKTRSRANWDETGALAMTAQKQAKLWKSAESFLLQYPDLANCPCRFDVALVDCRPSPQPQKAAPDDSPRYRFQLHNYIENAFM
jgi:putative endonuclease